MKTVTLFKLIQSELMKNGLNEFIDKNGELVLFKEEHQFINKILKYDDDVENVVNTLFHGLGLENETHDKTFKKNFTLRFLNRQINFQTVESFKASLLSTFLTNQVYMNMVYNDIEKFITQANATESKNSQTNNQKNTGETVTDNRQAYSELPQNNVQLDVNSTYMTSANDNTISRNKQKNNQDTTGETKGNTINVNVQYHLSELEKASELVEDIFRRFDRNCFLQVW